MLLTKKLTGNTNEYEVVTLTFASNKEEQFYINSKVLEPSIEIDKQIKSTLIDMKLFNKVKSVKIHTMRDGYQTNTRMLKI